VVTGMAALADAADQCPDPRPLIDAVHGTAALPLGPGRHRQVLEVEVVVVPVANRALGMGLWFDAHRSFCPLVVLCGVSVPSVPLRSRLRSTLRSLQFSDRIAGTCSRNGELQPTTDVISHARRPAGRQEARTCTDRCGARAGDHHPC